MGFLDDIDDNFKRASYKHVWANAGYIPYENQEKFHDNEHRHKAFIGGLASGKCGKFDTLIQLADGTTKKLEDMVPGDMVLTVAEDATINHSIVKDVIDSGIKDSYEVVLRNGLSVEVSQVHPFLKANVERLSYQEAIDMGFDVSHVEHKRDRRTLQVTGAEWTEVKDLAVSDYVAIPRHMTFTEDRYIDNSDAYLLGLLLGDGAMGYNSVSFSNIEPSLKDFVDSHITTKYQGVKPRVINSCTTNYTVQDKPCKPGSNELINWLRGMGVFGCTSDNKFIPKRIMSATKEEKIHVLRGLLETDGWVDTYGFGYATISEQLAKDVVLLLSHVGIHARLRVKRQKLNYEVKKKHRLDNEGKYTSYTVDVNRYEHLIIASNLKLLGFKNDKLLSVIKSKGKVPRPKGNTKTFNVGDLSFVQIKEINKKPPVQMYDLTIDGIHNFIGNGICLHNTIAGAAEVVKWGLDKPGARFMICAPTYTMLKRATMVEFFRFIKDDDIEYFNKSDMELKLKNGSMYWFVSLDDPDKASRGQTVAGVWIDEGGYITDYAFQVVLGRMRQPGYEHQLIVTTTPKGFNYLWKYFVDNPSKDEEAARLFWHIRTTIYDNPHLDEDFILTLEKNYSGSFKKQELEGDFVGFEGMVYSNFDASVHVGDIKGKKDSFKRVIYGVDWGFNNPTAIMVIGIDGDDNMYLVEEIYKSGLTIDQIIELSTDLQEDWGEGQWICDPSGPANIEAFTRAGLFACKANNAILEGIQAVGSRLEVPANGIPRFMIDRTCTNYINEINNYRYPDPKEGKPSQEKPIPIDDHAQDAVRYAVMYYDRQQTKLSLIDNSMLDKIF